MRVRVMEVFLGVVFGVFRPQMVATEALVRVRIRTGAVQTVDVHLERLELSVAELPVRA